MGPRISIILSLCETNLPASDQAYLGAPSAKSQPAFCGERYTVLEQLKRQYDEKRTALWNHQR